MDQYHGTTILSVRRGSSVALGGDGQVTLGNIVIKAGARKVRRLFNEAILAGFAGGTADAFTLFERFEAKLEKHQGNLLRLEPEQGILAIGSGGPYAQSAARALLENTDLAPPEIVKKALTIAADLCIYTNQNHLIETLE